MARFDSGSMSLVSTPRAKRSVDIPLPPLEVYVAEISDLEEILPSMSVADVIELVQSDMAELADVIAAEAKGKARKTILALIRTEGGAVYPRYSTAQDVAKDSDENPFA